MFSARSDAGLRRARSLSATTPPVRVGVSACDFGAPTVWGADCQFWGAASLIGELNNMTVNYGAPLIRCQGRTAERAIRAFNTTLIMGL